MLYNGEAIFGVVDFTHRSEAAAHRAAAIAQRGRALGMVAEVYSVEGASLGLVRLNDVETNSNVSCRNRPISAICCGELIDRRVPRAQYRAEPERSAFLERGITTAGEAFIEHLDGTFAAAIWNQPEQQLILACDWRADCRMYYSIEGDQLLFSSWLQMLAGGSSQIDLQSVAEFLRFLYIAPPKTIYRGISSVEPEHYVSVRRGRVQTHPLAQHCEWSSSKRADPNWNGNEVDEFQRLLEQAVARRIGERCAGVFLSSGVDSATIMAACAKLNPGRVKAFTIGFDNVDLDETTAARCLAKQLGIEHHELRYDLNQYRKSFDRMVDGFDQPFGDPAGLPLMLASDFTAGKVDVITGGTGGDDLFGAPIPRHLWFSKVIAARLPQSGRRQLAQLFGPSGNGRLFDFDELQELFITWSGWTKRELSELFGKSVSFDESGFYRKFNAYRNHDAQTLFDAMGVFPPDDCRFESAALAHVPIELPYHDLDLTAYVRGLPMSSRTSNGKTKRHLIELFGRYYPEGSLPKKKHYFNIPLQRLMAEANFELIGNYLSPVNLARRGLVDANRAGTYVDRFIAGDERLRFKVWALLILHAWLDKRV